MSKPKSQTPSNEEKRQALRERLRLAQNKPLHPELVDFGKVLDRQMEAFGRSVKAGEKVETP